MAAGANSDGRAGNSLADHKERAAGRQGQRGEAAEQIGEFEGEPADVPVDGAFGRDGVANRAGINNQGEGGGGGGGSPNSDIVDVGASKRPAR